jgi:hypothetical protein
MSHAALMTALYRLFYKRSERQAFAQSGQLNIKNLSAADLALLRAINPARLARSSELHAGELPAPWYGWRAPATWLALKATLDCSDTELAMRLTQSDAFELHIDDDRTLAALVGFVAQELARKDSQLAREAPWIGELLTYEKAVAGLCTDASGQQPTYLVLEFNWDITGIWASLLERNLCPTGESEDTNCLVLFTDQRGVNELQVSSEQASVMQALVALGASGIARAARGQDTAKATPPLLWRDCAQQLVLLSK